MLKLTGLVEKKEPKIDKMRAAAHFFSFFLIGVTIGVKKSVIGVLALTDVLHAAGKFRGESN